MRDGLIFIVWVVALSCCLGIAIDLVTANVAVEYFTVHHPHVVESDSPWVMALVWGIGASWWCGLILAPLLWWANLRRVQPLSRNRVLAMVVKAMALIWIVMMAILFAVYLIGGLVPEANRKPGFESGRRLMAVALSHASEYALAVLVAIVLWLRISRLGEIESSECKVTRNGL